MRYYARGGFYKLVLIGAVVVGAAVAVHAVAPSNLPNAVARSFDFPTSLGSAISGNLVSPIGAMPPLTFDHGTVAVGVLPVPLPQPLARLKQLRNRPAFFMPANDTAPHARLLLTGVVDANGARVTNSGNQLIIDAVVSPGSAASTMPPFVIPFDIDGGMAFVDAALPIQPQSDGSINVQVNGIAVNDPSGHLFAVLGFQVAAAAATATPAATYTPGTPPPEGRCFVGPNCMGPSFPAPQNLCCHFTRENTAAPFATSWCPANQFDPQTGQCAANACAGCGPAPDDCSARAVCDGACRTVCADGHVAAGKCQHDQTCACVADCSPMPTATPHPTRTPGPCETSNACGGACPFKCADGTTVAGQCVVLLTPNQPRGPICACEAECPRPPTPTPGPCGANGECKGTCTVTCADGTIETGTCVGFDPSSALGRFGCACLAACNRPAPPTFPPLPHGTVCCQCGDAANKCFEIPWIEVTPACPPGCQTIINGHCDGHSNTCVPAMPPHGG